MRKTGRELFMEKIGDIEDLVIDDELLGEGEDQEEVVDDILNIEEQKIDESEEVEA